MKSIMVILVFIGLISCNQSNQDGKATTHIKFYKGTKRIEVRYKKINRIIVDTAIYYDTFGMVKYKVIYDKGESMEKQIFDKKGIIKYTISNKGYINSYQNGRLIKTYNPEDSSFTFFYQNGGKKRFEKSCDGDILYYNEYDSLSHKPIKFYRDTREEIRVVNDSIIIRPYFECSNFRIEDFSYSIIFNEGKGKSEKIYTQKNKSPIFKFKLTKGLSWTKKLCDSIGCLSFPVEVENKMK